MRYDQWYRNARSQTPPRSISGWLSSPKTARRGVAAGVAGMTLAVFGTLLHPEIVSYTWIIVALVIGTIIGVPLSWVPLTAVPQRTALSHAFGGMAAGLVGTATAGPAPDRVTLGRGPDRARGDGDFAP